jgi:mono/diheme cytochrome c family protein
MGTLSDTQIHRIIMEGGRALGRSPQMPPWGGVMSDREIADVTAFIRTLAAPAKK